MDAARSRPRPSRLGSGGSDTWQRLGTLGRPVLLAALVIDAALALLHVVNLNALPILGRSTRILDMNGEQTLPAWWTSVQLFSAGLLSLAAIIGRWLSRRGQLTCVLAAFLFFFLSLDEYASLHERLGRATVSTALPVTGVWPIVFAAAGLLAALFVAALGRELYPLDRRAATWLLAGAAVYTGSAAGLELVANTVDPAGLVFQILSVIEETGELTGASVMAYGAWRLGFGGRSSAPAEPDQTDTRPRIVPSRR